MTETTETRYYIAAHQIGNGAHPESEGWNLTGWNYEIRRETRYAPGRKDWVKFYPDHAAALHGAMTSILADQRMGLRSEVTR